MSGKKREFFFDADPYCITILTVPRPLAHPTIEPAVPGSLINITVITLRMSIMSLLYTVNTFYNNYLIMFIMQHVKDYLLFICPIPAGARDSLHSNPVPLPRPPADPPVERQGFSPHVAW